MRALLALLLATSLSAQSPPDLSGLWAGTIRFGPDIRGTLIILRQPNSWRADIAGFSVPANSNGQTISFELPDDRGSFRGRMIGREIHGHWIQPRTQHSGLRYATPVTLVPSGPSTTNRWEGTVTPLDDRSTVYLPIDRSAGRYRTFIRNPERNFGRFVPVSGAEVHGDTVRFTGNMGEGERTLTQGMYEDGVIWAVRLRGGAYDFSRVTDAASSGFYPRGKPAPRYRYSPPIRLADGWPVATVEDVGISRDSIERFIQMLIDESMDSLATPQIHSILIARRGLLVVEEYFHGTHRDMPHDLRSASKSLVSVLVGAAQHAGIRVPLDLPVYETMVGAGALPADLDPRKRAMTLEHLMSMTAGYQCSSDMEAPGTADEDVIQQSGEQDFYGYTLNVPLISAPGERIFYCSAEPNLGGGMLEKVAREPQVELFDRLVGRPMQMRPYHLMLQPSGEAYGGGGHQLLPRDFLKLAQLWTDGTWNGRRILSADWIRRSRAPLLDLTPRQQYRWLWNSVEYTVGARKLRAFFAGGNGGQISMTIPDLDVVIAFTGGNYSQAATFMAQRVYVPQYLLPAVTGP